MQLQKNKRTPNQTKKERRRKMANVVIRDLEINEELDKRAMNELIGGFWGWGYYNYQSMSAFGFGPFGGWGYQQSSTSFGWGGFWW
jgi:hypothetical protein